MEEQTQVTEILETVQIDEQVPAPKQRRGFACMDRERVREFARQGGRAAHLSGKAHEFTTEEAREAGRKGGNAPHVRRGKAPTGVPAQS